MKLERLVKEELSGNNAKFYVSQISRFHRIQASPMFHQAAEYVKNELLTIGLNDATIEQFRSDGKEKYGTYTSPIGWNVQSGELRLVEPEDKLIVTYEDTPQSLHVFSKATAQEGVTAELVDVGDGTRASDYEGKDVKGKLVLATGQARHVHEQAVFKYGAVGILTDTVAYEMRNVRESVDIPDAHAYQAIWPSADELGKVKFGFSISKRQGNHLRTLLLQGKKVKLHAKVFANFCPSNLDVVTATIKGTSISSEEIFLIAHLCHPKPSANDNASGCGLLLEIARTVKSLIDSKKIAPPKRTIRFIWVPETYGSRAYLSSHKDVTNRFVAGLNLDMVGQDQELCRSTLNIDRTPDSLPSYLNDFVLSLMEQSVEQFDEKTRFGSGSTFRYMSMAFSGGSDHAEFVEATTKVPCIMLIQWPDLYYHTSMDTIDKVSADSLRRVGWISVIAALTLANATVETAFQLANQTALRSIVRVAETSREAIDELFKKMEDRKRGEITEELAETARHYRDKMAHVLWREQEAVRSVRRLGESRELGAYVERRCEDIRDLAAREKTRFDETLESVAKGLKVKVPVKREETKSERESKRKVPIRLFKGTLAMETLRRLLGEEEYEWYEEMIDEDLDFVKKFLELVNFMDGKRSVYEITRSVSAEYGETATETILKCLRDLEKIKLVAFK